MKNGKRKEQTVTLSIGPEEFIAKNEAVLLNDADINVIVPPSCEAICIVDGQASDVLTEGKTLVASTESQGRWAAFLEKLRLKSKNTLPPITIYCVNKSVPVKGKWGTRSRIEFRERETGIPVSAGLSGSYKAVVADSAKLLRNLLGLGKQLTIDSVNDYFLDEMVNSVRDKFYKIVDTGDVPFFELAGNLAQLGKMIEADLDDVFAQSGLKMTSFIVENVGLDDDVKEMARTYAIKAYQKRMNRDEIEERKEREEREYADKKERELWEREQISRARTQQAEIEYAKAAAVSGKPVAPEKKTKERFCSSCGAHLQAGAKFCSKCGAKQKIVCRCGYESVGNEKFCPNCGAKLN